VSEFKLYVPLLTLIDASYRPQEDLIAQHLQWLRSEGIKGLLVLGTTGEFPNLSVVERQRYLETVLTHSQGLEVMVNIGASSFHDVLALQNHALEQQDRISSLLWMPPFYYPDADINGLEAMLERLLENQPLNIPFLLYNYPKMSKIKISTNFLNQFPPLAGMKDTSGDFEWISTVRQECPEKQIFVGTDFEISRSRALGCAGIISSLSNLFPRLYREALSGRTESEEKLKSLSIAFRGYTKIPAMKAYLNAMNLSSEKSSMTFPFADMTTEMRQTLDKQVLEILKEEIPCR
jgi:4-hydroxy-tetrahydrodipicolinate synthase